MLLARAKALECDVLRRADIEVTDCALDPRGSSFTVRCSGKSELRIRCPLAGAHQVENAVTAALALRRLGIEAHDVERGIAAARWPGRLERVSSRPEIILDGAHNPSGARALAEYIRQFYGNKSVTLIYGAMRDKAVAETAAILFPAAQNVIATAPAQERATRPETIRELSGREDALVSGSVAEALRMASFGRPGDVIFVTGSLFLVAEARSLLL